MTRCEFLFDFGSPNSYLAWKILPDIEARSGVHFHYVPVLLGGIFKATGNASPVVAFAGVKGKLDYEMLEMRRFIKKHHLDAFRMNPNFPVNTLHLMRGAVLARNEGFMPAYMEAAMHHMWEVPKKMSEPDVFIAAFNESGLDGKAILEGTQNDAIKAELIVNTEQAVERGVFGAPSFFVDGELYFGKDRLRDVEEEILARKG
jgi:2-hydroxychromene-2-carboxylate isomerase